MIPFPPLTDTATSLPGTLHTQAEESVISAVQWLKLGIETIGAIVITLGTIAAGIQFARALLSRSTLDFTNIRLVLARYLALALEFQLGADILSTAIAPSWEQIGKLGAIAIIRTALNYFLSREMAGERQQASHEPSTNPDANPVKPLPPA